MQVQARLRLDLGNDLRQAVQENQFEVHYQPIIDLATGKAALAEALLRWPHPARGMVAPDTFIATAEEIGLIDAIGNEVFQQALNLAAWWRERQAGARISINVSPHQFISGSCRAWLKTLRQASLPPDLLAVEIVERLLLDERPVVI